METKEKIIDILIKVAEKKTCRDISLEEGDYFNIDDFAGGNIDDAYNLGLQDGEIELARRILQFFDKSINK